MWCQTILHWYPRGYMNTTPLGPKPYPHPHPRNVMTTSTIALTTTLADTDVETAVTATTAALAAHGFGILTEIDVAATMKRKLNVDMPPYLILGACNPGLAQEALGVLPQVGLLLPCNVVVRTDPADESGRTVLVEAMNPELMVTATGETGLGSVALRAGALLAAVIADIAP